MIHIELNMYQAVAVAALVLLLGRFLVSKFSVLTKYCIPEPVVGGVVFAVAHVILRSAGILEISFDSTLQTFFMTVFFCSVGFTACFRLLKKGGPKVITFLLVSIAMVCLQNVLSSVLAGLFGWKLDRSDKRYFFTNIAIVLCGIVGTATGYNPLTIIMAAQAVNGVFLPVSVFVLLYLASRSSVMGKHKNKPYQVILGTAVFVISLIIGVSSVVSLF